MKKFKVAAALTLALSLMFSTFAFAAPSPTAGTLVTSSGVSVAVTEVTNPAAVANISNAITGYVSNLPGFVANVKLCKEIVKPAGYVDGTPITFKWAVAGLADGAQVLIFHQKADGTVEAVVGTVKDGIVTFTLSSLSPVAIVELTQAAAPAAVADGLHQTGDADYAGLFLALALLSGGALLIVGKRSRAEG